MLSNPFSKPLVRAAGFLLFTGLTIPTPGQAAPPDISLARTASKPISVAVDGVSRAECFPIEGLSPELRARAESLLLEALDGEALYTLVGGIKPMSSGWLQEKFDLDKPNGVALEELRTILTTFSCGDEISAHLSHFSKPRDGKVLLQGALFNRSALDAELSHHAGFWQEWAITPQTEPLEVLLAVEYAAASRRSRGYGYLYGYPQHAVDFYVDASAQQANDPADTLVPRDFLQIPAFKGDTGHFVYAVPKGQQPNAVDLALRQRAQPILAEYRRRRERYIGAGKPGAAVLLRDWFDNGQGRCSPRFAKY